MGTEKTESPSHRSRGSSKSARVLPKHRASEEQQRLPAPDQAMWKDLIRPVDFQTRQERGSYVLLAGLPGLSTEDLKIELHDDQSVLTITGLCQPSTRQAEKMQQELL